MKRKAFLLVVCVLVLTLSGCMPYRPAYEARQTRGLKTILTVLAGQSTSDAGIEDMVDEMLETALPNIALEWECVDWGDQFAPQIAIKVAAGEVPDMLIGKAQDVTTYARSGLLAPLSGPYLDRVPKASLSVVTVGGQVYGITYNALYQGVFYNKDIFRRLGLHPPGTVQEMRHVVQTLRETGIVPFASHYQDVWSVANMAMQFAVNEVFTADPAFGDRLRAGEASFLNSAAYTDCIKTLTYILDNTWSDTFSIGQKECDERFAAGESAMYVTGTWSLQQITQAAPDMEVGIFPYPNRSSNARLIFEPNLTLMVSARTTRREAAEQVLTALFDDTELAAKIAIYTQAVPMVKGVESAYESAIQPDIDNYITDGRIVDVSIGNTQLVWTFQEEFARRVLAYLMGTITLQDVLLWADANIPG